MSDEEKEAIETTKIIIEYAGDSYIPKQNREKLKILLNLIEKQRKEIEELKDIQQKICNEELLEQEYVKEYFIAKDKIKSKIEEFKKVRDEILKNEKEFNRPMMTYDLKRNDYCEKMLQSLLKED